MDDVTVYLLKGGARILDGSGSVSTMTNASGVYQFSVVPGTYSVEFVLPSGRVFSPKGVTTNGGNDATDSDADVSTGRTGTVTVASGGSADTLDAGVYEREWACVGGRKEERRCAALASCAGLASCACVRNEARGLCLPWPEPHLLNACPPPAVVDPNESYSGPEDQPISGNVLTNTQGGTPSTQDKYDTLQLLCGGYTIRNASGSVLGALDTRTLGAPEAIPDIGSLTLNTDGSFTFTPVTDWAGTILVDYDVCGAWLCGYGLRRAALLRGHSQRQAPARSCPDCALLSAPSCGIADDNGAGNGNTAGDDSTATITIIQREQWAYSRWLHLLQHPFSLPFPAYNLILGIISHTFAFPLCSGAAARQRMGRCQRQRRPGQRRGVHRR